jgi:hypothetical protein
MAIIEPKEREEALAKLRAVLERVCAEHSHALICGEVCVCEKRRPERAA